LVFKLSSNSGVGFVRIGGPTKKNTRWIIEMGGGREGDSCSGDSGGGTAVAYIAADYYYYYYYYYYYFLLLLLLLLLPLTTSKEKCIMD